MAINFVFGFDIYSYGKVDNMINKISITNNYSNTVQYNPKFKGHDDGSTLNKTQKAKILGSSAVGVGSVMAVLAKHKGFSLNPIRIAKTPIKDWAIFRYKPENNIIEFKAPQIIAVATGSVAGGYIGGSIVDKQNKKAKKREVLNQLLGNVLVPVGCVASGAMLYDKYAKQIEWAMPQIKPTIFKGKATKAINVINKILTKLPNAGGTILFLSVGIFLGNRVSNLINEKLYHKKVDRNIRPTDFAPHIDDVCMATTMMNKGSSFGEKLGRIIPLALLVPGYETGIAQD
jgi:hypothetical protein